MSINFIIQPKICFVYSGFHQKILKVAHITLKKIVMNHLGHYLEQVLAIHLMIAHHLQMLTKKILPQL